MFFWYKYDGTNLVWLLVPDTVLGLKSLNLFSTWSIRKCNNEVLFINSVPVNSFVPAKLTYVNANIAQGFLVVLGAQIGHFSRFGLSTKDDPLN